MSLYIFTSGHYCEPVEHTLPELKTVLKASTGQSFRRIGRFIQLGLIAVGRCCKEIELPPATGIYLGSDSGDIELNIDVHEQMYVHGMPPKPLSFINTVSNSACFYIGKYKKLCGSSQFVSSRSFSFERALQLASLDMLMQRATTALVGSVALCVEPLKGHRQRLGIDPAAPVAEGSHWYLLANSASAFAGEGLTCQGKIRHIRQLPNRAALDDYLQQIAADTACNANDIRLLCNTRLNQAQQHHMAELCAGQLLPNDAMVGYYDGQQAQGLQQLLDSDGCLLLHISADNEGRFCVTCVERSQ